MHNLVWKTLYIVPVCVYTHYGSGFIKAAVFLRMLVRNLGERRAFLPTSERASECPFDGGDYRTTKEREMRPSFFSFSVL